MAAAVVVVVVIVVEQAEGEGAVDLVDFRLVGNTCCFDIDFPPVFRSKKAG